MSVFTSIDAKDVSKNLPLMDINMAVETNGAYHNRFSETMFQNLHPQLNTYNELFNNAVTMFSNRPCLAYRPYNPVFQTYPSSYKTLSYTQVQRARCYLGSGILYALYKNQFKYSEVHNKIDNHLENWANFGATDHSFILTIYSDNRYEWILTDLACVGYSITNTALYDTLGESSTEYILNVTKSPVVVCSADKIKKLKKLKSSGKAPELICIICMDNNVKSYTDYDLKLEVFSFQDIISLGKSHKLNQMPPTVNTIYTISFTSGTTSNPKGVILKNEQAVAANTFLSTTMKRVNKGKTLVFLPLAHIYERQTSAYALSCGYMLGFPKSKKSSDVLRDLIEDLKIYRPDYVSLVPRILNKLQSEVKSYLEKVDDFKLNQIIEQKIMNQKSFDGNKASTSNDFYPPYVKLRKRFGLEYVDWINTASAPANPATLEFLRASMNIGVRQLYGATETFGAISTTSEYDTSINSSGIISICTQFKLGENNELLVRGATVTPGYFEDPEETAKAFQDGWYSTGDVATVGKKGEITIIDRAKNFFKMSQGEYVSPERLENIYVSCNTEIESIFIHGKPTESFLIGFLSLKDDNKIPKTRKEKIELLKRINGSVQGINRLEKIQNVHVGTKLLADILTPTFKLKRKDAIVKFSELIDALYEEGPLLSSKM
ncbi:acetyl-CoA synthetase-like protein [Yamadazyma tenuis ATCC 10573]|uniref:Acetyl-CoA synthetase-like protein n=1 Tax=Candida tenuis (strain ATCC 10573 / BCRC 21748 / CBS 615 / JCM 9827 / NBRC 10315 / NRRL Y-1498 / VKM Y-70) TaxID=590646 RepID=G3AWJ4_CANTC|nr:acetyl-CoA synthetase-like protein [Yamadazyma tenuis ATCC 10573]EGV66553.1 acetyl-CoA synthetase-like protein [Yamadazyma tenuis ATCC 10573]